MRFLPRFTFALTSVGIALAASLSLAPSTAEAAEVMCSNDYGSCSVSNNGFDSIFCECEGGAGGGSTGGDDLAGLSEAELLEVCEGWLMDCEEFGSESGSGESETGVFDEGFETTFGTVDEGFDTDWGESTTGGLDEGFETTFGTFDEGLDTEDWGETTFGDEGFETFGEEGNESTTGGLDSDTGEGDGTTGTSDGGTADSGGGDDAADSGDTTTGAGETSGDGESSDGEEGGETGTDGESEGNATTDEAADDGETAGGETGGGQDLDEAGCSCSAEDAGTLRNMGLAVVLLVGAFGLRRRND